MKTSRLPVALLLTAVLAVAGGCRGKDRDGPEGVKMGFVPADGENAHGKALQEAAQAVAKDRGFELIVADPRGKAADQAQAVEQLLQKDVSVILIDPLDAQKLRPALSKATEGKVYLVTMQRTVPDVDVATKVTYKQD